MSIKISGYIPKQKRMSTVIGGIMILVGEAMFMFSILNFLLITRIQYYNPGDSYMRDLFPHYTLFLVFMFITAVCVMIFIYIFIIPSKVSFANKQAIKDERNPMYNLLVDVSSDIDDIKKDIDVLKQFMK